MMTMKQFSDHNKLRLRVRKAFGFTLIELLVVIAIIAVLIGCCFPQFRLREKRQGELSVRTI